MRILSVANKFDTSTANLMAEYGKRLRGKFNLTTVQIKPQKGSQSQAIKQESELLLKNIKPGEFIILLDETGEQMNSPGFSKLVSSQAQTVVFIVGGAYGVSDELKSRADLVLSLSLMVLPHRLAMIVLLEQIYRAQTIYDGHPYHHS
ncbi:MAG: 23S rRNA (pseudouridine(1915)-N(3))-methyltransferase RlmH [bacterium]|nr:23S rRNA (pseudouridine(1915)-N(3))-methyltransferase RlmH [bacterium]